MALTYDVLKEKILGCFNGKNIGGALGAPFECYRGTFPVNYYTQKDIDNNPPPNDDLDLQLVWLNAVETFGNKITLAAKAAKVVGEICSGTDKQPLRHLLQKVDIDYCS